MRNIGSWMIALGALAMYSTEGHALPAWARKYNMNCSGCHAPAVPRLNAKGFAFKWAGYRMPEEIGEAQEVKQISEYLAARTVLQYAFEKTETQPTTTSQFQFGGATLFAAGALGKNFGTMIELSHASDGNEIVANVVGVWGNEKTHYGLRGGQMHWLYEGGVAGFDRPTGLNAPTPLGLATTGGVPFVFDSKQLGVEAFLVQGRNRLSFEILNGFRPDGSTEGHGSPTTKDFVAIDQLIYDDAGSGLSVAGYFGSIDGLDTAAVAGTAHFTRVAVTANKISHGVELLGGYAFGSDADLPVGKTYDVSTMRGNGYWVYGGYTFPQNALTLFGRYEFVNPNTAAIRAGSTRVALGGVLPVSLPEYLRVAAEYTLDTPRAAGALKTHGFGLELMVNF